MSNFSDVRMWMGMVGQYAPAFPVVPEKVSSDVVVLRERLMREELNELLEGMDTNNIVEIADGIGDLLVVTYGTAVAYGINADAVFSEVHRSNMSKILPDGTCLKDAGGKVLKPEGYFPPDITRVLASGR